MTSAEQQRVEEIAAGLTKAQREALASGRWNHDPLCADFMIVGVVKRTPTVSWPYYVELSPLGLAVRTHLQEQAS